MTKDQFLQIELDFFSEPPMPESKENPKLNPSVMRQAALGFLATKHPAGLATLVPTRSRKYKVAAAAFWTRENSRGKSVEKTTVIEICNARERCFAEYADQQPLLDAIAELRIRREKLQAEIRITEPHLADADDLFSEFRTWRYHESKNPSYQKLCRKIEKLQRILHNGSRLEKIRRANAADNLYLAVPDGLVAPDEIIFGWGLLYIKDNGEVKEICRPSLQYCEPDKRNMLALNIGAASARDVLFSSGIALNTGGKVQLYRRPRKRTRKSL